MANPFRNHLEKFATDVYDNPDSEEVDSLMETHGEVNVLSFANEHALHRELERGRALLVTRDDPRLRHFINAGQSWIKRSSVNDMNNMNAALRLLRVLWAIQKEVGAAEKRSDDELNEPFDEDKYGNIFMPVVAPASRSEHAERMRRCTGLEMPEYVGRPLFEDFIVAKKSEDGSKKKKKKKGSKKKRRG